MTDFVLRSAAIAAERIIEARSILVLTAKESEAFVELLLNPPEPGPVLRAAFHDYLRMTGK